MYDNKNRNMLNQIERNILKKIAETQLISKPELRRFLETNGNSGNDMTAVVDTITRRLVEQNFISSINPVGSTCYLITQRGTQFLRDMEI
jgi:predicted transcriptional regulator